MIVLALQYFHLCNHQFKKQDYDGEIHDISVKNSKTQVDIIIDGATVLDIIEVRALMYDPFKKIDPFFYDNEKKNQTYEDVDDEDGYYDDVNNRIIDYAQYFKDGETVSEPLPQEFYQSFLHNRIKWNVKPPTEYIVKAKVYFSGGKVMTYDIGDCPVCQGKGWFVDVLNFNGVYVEAEGITRIAQRVVKDFLTKVNSSIINLEYGTLVWSVIARGTTDDEVLFDDIRLILSEIEDNYIERQTERISELEDDEILVRLNTKQISRSSSDQRRIVIDLQIQTQAENRVLRIAI